MKKRWVFLILCIVFFTYTAKVNLCASELIPELSEEEVLLQGIVGEEMSMDENNIINIMNKKTIRVAWYEREGYFEKDSAGNLYGFGMDYLNAISEHTGWNYEFLKGTRAQCIRYLETGLADIMAPVGVNEEFENAKVAREVIGEDYGYIYKAANNYHLNFEDVDAFRQVVLGIEEESGLLENLKRYCDEKGIRFYEIIMYDTLDEMRMELSEGKIDAFVTDSYVQLDNLKVIGHFSNNRVTFAANRDYILEQLNYALENIKLENPDFSTELKAKHFGEGSQNYLEYTEKERRFLNIHHVYKVVLNSEQYPISYVGNGEEKKGITKDILEKIENQTGVVFDLIYDDSYSEAEKLLKNGEADILGGVILSSEDIRDAEYSEEQNLHYTDAYYDMKMAFVGRKNTNVEEALTVAIPAYLEQAIDDLQEMYTICDFVVYESDMACFDAILNGSVDVAVQSEMKINEISIYEKYKSLQNLKYIPGSYVATFYVNSDEKILIPVLNKAIRSISDASMASIVNNNMQHIAMQNMSFSDIWLVYKGYIILGIAGLVIAFSAISFYQRYKREQADKEKAYRDSVANISSMEKFRIDVEPVLKNQGNSNYYILAVDIDKFKVVNTLYGYQEGDRMLAFIARMLQVGLQQGDCITRSSADNFVVLKKAEKDEDVTKYLEEVYECIDKHIAHQDSNYRIMLKIGIYRITAEDNNISGIIDRAIMAKKTIGQIHTSTHEFYSEDMRQRAIEAKKLENEMEIALEERQFCVYLQPQIDLQTKKIASAEALVRWKHPDKGMISPAMFVPVFENNGFITKLDLFIWEETIKTVAKWRDNHQLMVPLAINLSRADVEKDGMIEKLIDFMEKYQLETKWIKTELTESMYSDEDSVIMDRMQKLKDYGFKIAVDDFGSGYSSLHLLKKMPIDIMKIDKSFLEIDADMDIRDEIVIRDVVDMGKHLNLQIIVEGVETKEQSDFLEMLGCDIAQGYYYGGPVSVPVFEGMLKESYGG